MKHIILAFAATTLLLTGGCHQTIEDKHTAAVDSTLAVLEAAHKITAAIDVAEISRLHESYKVYYDFFSNEYTDISNKDFYTHELMDMAECTKRFGISKDHIGTWKEELEESIERLEKLRHDYTNGLLSEEEFLKYFEQEKYPAANVNHEVDENIGSVSACLRNHEKLVSKLDSAKAAFLSSIE